MNQQTPSSATLRVVTMPPPSEVEPCDDTYTCQCAYCTVERARRVQHGIKTRPAFPLKRAA